MDTHRMGQEIAQHWQQLKSSLQVSWEKLTREKSNDGSSLPRDLEQEHALTRDREAGRQKGTTAKKDAFQKMSEVNGDMKLNQYVENPAPGPSQRHGPQGENNVCDAKAEKKTGE